MAVKTCNITLISLTIILITLCINRAAAQSGCTTAMISLSPCLNYVGGNSSSPSPSCCTQLSNVVQSQPQCLCALLKGGASNIGVAVNQTLALALPGACNVQTPPVSQCGAVSGPGSSAPAPALSPADNSPAEDTPDVPDTPSETDVPSGTAGSKTVPRTDGSSVGGSNKGATFSFVGIFVLIASSSWAFSGSAI